MSSAWPVILEYDASTWAMLYVDMAAWTLNYATAPKATPYVWTKAVADNPILSGAGGNLIRGVGAYKEGDGTYRILYDIVGSICYAYGAALNALTKHDAADAPVFSGQGILWEAYVRHPSLLKVGSTYHMWYDGRQDAATGEVGAIGHAMSNDLITWTRDTGNPVLTPRVGGFESSDVAAPFVVEWGDVYYMFYSGYDGSGSPYPHRLGYAANVNPDGVFWRSPINPLLSLGAPSSWEETSHNGTSILADAGGDILVYGAHDSALVHAVGCVT